MSTKTGVSTPRSNNGEDVTYEKAVDELAQEGIEVSPESRHKSAEYQEDIAQEDRAAIDSLGKQGSSPSTSAKESECQGEGVDYSYGMSQ